jgi:hypothetical protein
MRRTVTLVAILFFAALPAFAQTILPRSFDSWTALGTAVPMQANSTTGTVPIAPQQVLVEYGWTSTESLNYANPAAPSSGLQATVFRMKDPSGAYGLYSYLRTPEMSRAQFTEHSSIASDHALILSGNLVLDVRGPDLPKLAADLGALASAVVPHAEQGVLPSLWQRLPPRGMMPGTDRYVLGPQTLNQLFPVPLGYSLGFSRGSEAELARYQLGNHQATLLIADFPTPQIALSTLADLEKKFNVNGSNLSAPTPALFAKRSLTMLELVAGATSDADANGLLNQIQTGAVLTWNEPSFSVTQPSIETMVVGAIVGTGIICLFTLIASFAFGGFRLLVKRIIPGKIFDRPEQIRVLQLGISSKPIKAEDFYDRSGPPVGKATVDKNLPDRIALRIFR